VRNSCPIPDPNFNTSTLHASTILDYDYEHKHEHEREFVIPRSRPLRFVDGCWLREALPRSLSQRTKPVELLDLDWMRSVYLLLEHGIGQLITLRLKGTVCRR
jgi:hypothetical protein